jgi:hypothetical protein
MDNRIPLVVRMRVEWGEIRASIATRNRPCRMSSAVPDNSDTIWPWDE